MGGGQSRIRKAPLLKEREIGQYSAQKSKRSWRKEKKMEVIHQAPSSKKKKRKGVWGKKVTACNQEPVAK